jgi:hypothetical protein
MAFNLRQGERGNVFFTLFGAVALVGVIGVATSTLMKGPVGTVVNLNQKAKVESQLQIARKLAALYAAQGEYADCDNDGTIEPARADIATTGCSGLITGGGCLPVGVSAAKTDPWGTLVGYCAWDHAASGGAGSQMDGSDCGYVTGEAPLLRGTNAADKPVLAVISAGPNRTFEVSCHDHDTYVQRPANSDDFVFAWTYDEAASGLGSGLWSLMSDTGAITTNRNLEISSDTRFAGKQVDFTDGAIVDLSGASKMLLPSQINSGECNVANTGIVRTNSADGGQVLQICDPSPGVGWVDVGGSGSATSVAGVDGDIQFNSGGKLFAVNALNWDIGTGRLNIGNPASVTETLNVNGSIGATTTITAGTRFLAPQSTGPVPVFSFNGADTTGLYYDNGKVGLAYTGIERLAIDATGASITGSLSVSQNATVTSDLSVGSDAQIDGNLGVDGVISSSSGTVRVSGNFSVTGTSSLDGNVVTAASLLSTGTINAPFFAVDGSAIGTAISDGNTGLTQHIENGTLGLALQTGGVPRLIVDQAGDVGVGSVTDPTTALDIGGVMRLRDTNATANASCWPTVPEGSITYASGDLLLICSGVTHNWEIIGTSGGGGGGGFSLWTHRNNALQPKDILGYEFFMFGNTASPGSGGSYMMFDRDTASFRAGNASSTVWNTRGTASIGLGRNTQASGNHSVAIGTDVSAVGQHSFAFGLGIPASGSYPRVSGSRSFGIFMGNQANVNLAVDNVMLLAGGSLVIDPSSIATKITPTNGLTVDVEGSVGAINFCDENGLNCFTASDISGGTTGAPGLDRQLLFNSAGAMSATPDVYYTSAGKLGLGVANPVTRLDVNGSVRISSGGELCNAATEGAIIYVSASNIFQVCRSEVSGWETLAAGTDVQAADPVRGIQFNSAGKLAAVDSFVFTPDGHLGIGRSGPTSSVSVHHPADKHDPYLLFSNANMASTLDFSGVKTDTVFSMSSLGTEVGGTAIRSVGKHSTTAAMIMSGISSLTSLGATSNTGLVHITSFKRTGTSIQPLAANENIFSAGYHNLSSYLLVKGDGRVSIGTDLRDPRTKLDVAGTVKLGYSGEACDTNRVGAIRYVSSMFEVCDDGLTWKKMAYDTGKTVAAGSDREIQFNSGGNLAAVDAIKFTSKNVLNLSGRIQTTWNFSPDDLGVVNANSIEALIPWAVTLPAQQQRLNALHVKGVNSGAKFKEIVGIVGEATLSGHNLDGVDEVVGVLGTTWISTGADALVKRVIGVKGISNNSYNGDIRDAMGIYALAAANTKTQNLYGANISVTSVASASVGNRYSLFIGSTGGDPLSDPNKDWAIYSKATQNSSLLGSLKIKSNAPPVTALDVVGTLKLGYSGENCDVNRLGAIRFISGEYHVCPVAGTWQKIATGEGNNAAGSNREIQFNSGGQLAATGGFKFTSAGALALTSNGNVASIPSDAKLYIDDGVLYTSRAWSTAAAGNSLGGHIYLEGGPSSTQYSASGTALKLDVVKTPGTAGMGNLYGLYSAASVPAGNSTHTEAAHGIYSRVASYSSSSVDSSYGAYLTNLTHSGTNLEQYGTYTIAGALATGNVTSSHGHYIRMRKAASATITNRYGIYFQPYEDNASANDWVIYSLATQPSSFAGAMKLGANTVPAAALDVAGTVKMGYGNEACDANRVGSIRFTSGEFHVCPTAGTWQKLAAGNAVGAAGADREVQFNSGGQLTASPKFRWIDGTATAPAKLMFDGTYDFTYNDTVGGTVGVASHNIIRSTANPVSHSANRTVVSSHIMSEKTGTRALGGLIGNYTQVYSKGGNTIQVLGSLVEAGHTNGGGSDNVYNISSVQAVSSASTGNTTWLGSIHADSRISGTAKVANNYGILVSSGLIGSAEVSSRMGIYLQEPTGTVTPDAYKDWAIFSDSSKPSFFKGRIGIGTDQPTASLDTTGTIKMGTGNESCGSALYGAIRYHSAKFEVCDNGTAWKPIATDTGIITAAGANREIQFNSGGQFAAMQGLKFTSSGLMVLSNDGDAAGAQSGSKLYIKDGGLHVNNAYDATGNGEYWGNNLHLTANIPVANTGSIVGGNISVSKKAGSANLTSMKALNVASYLPAASADTQYLSGMDVRVDSYTTGTVANSYGSRLINANYGGTQTNQHGLHLYVGGVGGTVTNSYGQYVEMSKPAGFNVTNRYGLYFKAFQGAATNNDYVLYSEATQPSYLTGPILYGDSLSFLNVLRSIYPAAKILISNGTIFVSSQDSGTVAGNMSNNQFHVNLKPSAPASARNTSAMSSTVEKTNNQDYGIAAGVRGTSISTATAGLTQNLIGLQGESEVSGVSAGYTVTRAIGVGSNPLVKANARAQNVMGYYSYPLIHDNAHVANEYGFYHRSGSSLNSKVLKRYGLYIEQPANNVTTAAGNDWSIYSNSTMPSYLKGNLQLDGLLKVGQSAEGCGSTIYGAIRYNSSNSLLESCESGNTWRVLGAGNNAAAGNDRQIQFNSANTLAAADGLKFTSKSVLELTGRVNVKTTVEADDSADINSIDVTIPSSIPTQVNVVNGLKVKTVNSSVKAKRANAIVGEVTSGNVSVLGSDELVGVRGSVWFSMGGAGVHKSAVGVMSDMTTLYNGNLTDAIGFHSKMHINSVNVTNVYGLKIDSTSGAASNLAVRRYAIHIGEPVGQALANADNDWAIYSRSTRNSSLLGSVKVKSNDLPVTALDVAGTLKLGSGSEACNATYYGSIRYNSSTSKLENCVSGTAWTTLGGGAAAAAGADRDIQFNSGGTMAGNAALKLIGSTPTELPILKLVGKQDVTATITTPDQNMYTSEITVSPATAFSDANDTTGILANISNSSGNANFVGNVSGISSRVRVRGAAGAEDIDGGRFRAYRQGSGNAENVVGLYALSQHESSGTTRYMSSIFGHLKVEGGSTDYPNALSLNFSATGNAVVQDLVGIYMKGNESTSPNVRDRKYIYADHPTVPTTRADYFIYSRNRNMSAFAGAIAISTNDLDDLKDEIVPGTLLHVEGGNVNVIGNIQYTGTLTDISDMRLKKDITPLIDKGSMLERIMGVDTYTYRMKDDADGQVEYGVMAQEIEKIFPEIVMTANDEMRTKSVNYIGLIAPMIEATKELKADNDNLRQEMASLKAMHEKQADIIQALADDVKGMKAHTGYGVGRAEMGLLFILLLMGAGGAFYMVARRKKAA